ncbi:peptidoglycan-binding domain-containing protein [Streptomyces sp. P9-2B-2]|uniref:peptidoglycan-binding domain-containing protein n=1 Tax=Streptomyces TaxID=1883 RepID=UPI001B3C5F82|nr:MULTISPECIES: peptidoglycan-binding protein [Streptomyces]MCX4636832.1 peptidoglycan-binding protein [Streptomyces platensis]WJY40107.1 peptidoglycan-binding domain-containing protein [Streptomyces sp. P9-2B-2]
MTGPTAADRDAVRALAELLRTWWELSAREGRPKPTQQSLAGRLSIDQTTLSRYLNPRHPSTAPLRTVELLHTVLRAPAADLPRARALAEAAAAGAARKSPRPCGTVPADGSVDPAPVPAARVTRRTAAARAALAFLGVLTLGGGIGLGWGVLAHRAGPDGPPVAAVAASAGPTAAGWPLARKGDLLWKARAVQYLLRAHGHDIEADGDFGVRTAAAVKKFQAAHGLLADGKVGARTWSHLIIRIDSQHAPQQAVVALQYLLDNSGTATDITGLFTPSTTRSLETFQRDRALPVTGVADRDTWRALLTAQGPGIHR